jgi:hypothetical protein
MREMDTTPAGFEPPAQGDGKPSKIAKAIKRNELKQAGKDAGAQAGAA